MDLWVPITVAAATPKPSAHMKQIDSTVMSAWLAAIATAPRVATALA